MLNLYVMYKVHMQNKSCINIFVVGISEHLKKMKTSQVIFKDQWIILNSMVSVDLVPRHHYVY